MTIVAVVLGLAAHTASANDVCVASDPARETLSSEEQDSVRKVFENVVIAAGRTVGPPCDESWMLTHVRLGDSIHVLVTTPRGALTATASGFDTLGATYEGLTWRALAAAATEPRVASAAPRAEATAAHSAASAALPHKGAFYVRVGYAAAPALTNETMSRLGPTIGVGYRRATGPWLFDLSIMNTHAWSHSRDNYEVNFLSFGRLVANRLLVEQGPSTWYIGGGISFGHSVILEQTEVNDFPLQRAGYAVQLEGAVGYEALRQKSVTLFFEGWLTAPLGGVVVSPDNEYWAPTLNFATGIGF